MDPSCVVSFEKLYWPICLFTILSHNRVRLFTVSANTVNTVRKRRREGTGRDQRLLNVSFKFFNALYFG